MFIITCLQGNISFLFNKIALSNLLCVRQRSGSDPISRVKCPDYSVGVNHGNKTGISKFP